MAREINLSKLKPNEQNPRTITEDDFELLVKNIKEFPEMLKIRKIVVDENWKVIGGNMRHKALVHLGYDKIPAAWVAQVKDFNEEQWKKFLVLDNSDFGKWDYEQLMDLGYDAFELSDYGVEVPKITTSTGEEVEPSKRAVYNEYTIYFESEEEEDLWMGFLRNLKEGFPDQENVSRRILNYLANVYSENNQMSESQMILGFIKDDADGTQG